MSGGRRDGGERREAGDSLGATLDADPSTVTFVAEAARPGATPSRSSSAAEELARGELVDRYLVLSRLGRGGMGIVYAAYDPELDRKVALKLVPARRDGDPEAHVRLLREAQAMAQLSHPNVVTVHDVGAQGDRVWIAMEFVEGHTLSEWLEQRERSWREILPVFMQAGAGLQRAHAAGLVHRDFKPDNVMVSPDGRVRVMDFGLARAERPERAASRADLGALDLGLTQPGTLVGTPRYMAPEQWIGDPIDARTDQFSFCVALWAAVFGEPPFRGHTMIDLATAVTGGRIQVARKGRTVPAWLQRVLERGLMAAPARRFPSMEALLQAIERGRAGSRSRRALFALAAVAALVVGAGAWQQHDRRQRAAACEAAGAEIHDVWNDATRAALRDAFVATNASYAATTADRVIPWIDRWVGQWSATRAAVCREADLEGARSPEHHALAAACLADRRDELAALLDVLGEADATVVPHAVAAAAGLSLLAPCSERAALERRPQPPADEAARLRVRALRRDLMRVQGLLSAGRYAEGLARAQELLAAAEAEGYAPLVAAAATAVGRLAHYTGEFALAERALTRAFVEGGARGDDEVAALAAVELVYIVGQAGHRSGEALQWGQAADLFVRRIGQEQGLLGAGLLNNLGIVHMKRGAHDEAREHHERALAVRTEVLGPDHPWVGDSLINLGDLHRVRGAYEQALAYQRRVLAQHEAVLGPDHPDIGIALNNLAATFIDRHEPAEALPLLERALSLWERALGPEHPYVVNSLANLANVHSQIDDLERALGFSARAVALVEKTAGADTPRFATILGVHAAILYMHGDDAEALARYQRVLAIQEQTLGPDHPDLAATLVNIAVLHIDAQAPALALPSLDRALAIEEKVFPGDHPRPLSTLARRGRTLADLGRSAEAVAPLERALAGLEPETVDPALLAETRFALARAVAGLPAPDRERARRLAAEAAELYRAAGPSHDSQRADVEAWRDRLSRRGAAGD